MADASTDAAACLAEVRADWDRVGGKPVRHVPRLLAALEAALALTGEWRQDAKDLNGKAAGEGGPTTSALLRSRAQALTDAAERLERVITRELLGESRPRLRETITQREDT